MVESKLGLRVFRHYGNSEPVREPVWPITGVQTMNRNKYDISANQGNTETSFISMFYDNIALKIWLGLDIGTWQGFKGTMFSHQITGFNLTTILSNMGSMSFKSPISEDRMSADESGSSLSGYTPGIICNCSTNLVFGYFIYAFYHLFYKLRNETKGQRLILSCASGVNI